MLLKLVEHNHTVCMSADNIYLNTNRLRRSRTATAPSRITTMPKMAPITMVELFWIRDSAVQLKERKIRFVK